MSETSIHTDLRRLAERRVDARRSFAGHAVTYVVANAAMAAWNLAASPQHWWQLWFLWPLLGWGGGLASHAWTAFGPGPGRREDAVQAELEALRRRHGVAAR